MIDPVSPHIIAQVFDGLQKAITHFISVGHDRGVSKEKLLELASKALSDMTQLRLELGDDLCIEDRDKYRTFVEEHEKDVSLLKRKRFGGKTAAERLHLEVKTEHSDLYSKSSDIKRARDVGQVPGRSSPQSFSQHEASQTDGTGSVSALPSTASFNVQAQAVHFNNCTFNSGAALQQERHTSDSSPLGYVSGQNTSREGSVSSPLAFRHEAVSQREGWQAPMAETREVLRQMESVHAEAQLTASIVSGSSSEDELASSAGRAEPPARHNAAGIIGRATAVTKALYNGSPASFDLGGE